MNCNLLSRQRCCWDCYGSH